MATCLDCFRWALEASLENSGRVYGLDMWSVVIIIGNGVGLLKNSAVTTMAATAVSSVVESVGVEGAGSEDGKTRTQKK